jgi:chromosomal replication initiation ATPase DnaA
MNPYVIAGLRRNDMPETLIRVTPNDLLAIVCNYFEIDVLDIKQKNRKRKIVYPRQIAIYLMREYTELSLNDIAIKFDRAVKDHTTVIHSHREIKNLYEVMPNVKSDIRNIKNIISEVTQIRRAKFNAEFISNQTS